MNVLPVPVASVSRMRDSLLAIFSTPDSRRCPDNTDQGCSPLLWSGGLRAISGGCHGQEFMLALLTRQRHMLKTGRFFNTFRERVAIYRIPRFNIRPTMRIRSFTRASAGRLTDSHLCFSAQPKILSNSLYRECRNTSSRRSRRPWRGLVQARPGISETAATMTAP